MCLSLMSYEYVYVAKFFLSVVIFLMFFGVDIAYVYGSDNPSSATSGIVLGFGIVLALLVWKTDGKSDLPGMKDPLIERTPTPPGLIYGQASVVYSTSLAARDCITGVQNTQPQDKDGEKPTQNLFQTVRGTLIEKNDDDDNSRKHEASNHITV